MKNSNKINYIHKMQGFQRILIRKFKKKKLKMDERTSKKFDSLWGRFEKNRLLNLLLNEFRFFKLKNL